MYQQFICLILWISIAYILVSANDKKHSKNKQNKKHLSMHGGKDGANYGADLPSFSFDFSEYFISAMIERSDKYNDFYLTMLVLSHDVIDNTHSLHSISTEDEILHQWGYTLKTWNANSFHDYNNLACVIKNNDNRRPTFPYFSHLSWITDYHNDSLAILRCKLKGLSNSSADYTSISVDIIRKKNSRNYLNITKNHDQSSAIISFSVPWRNRFTGYGFNFFNSSNYDPWFKENTGPERTHLCTSLIRPLNPLLSIVGIPVILEYIEHHLMLGADHIFLPILLDWNSRYIQRYLTVLRSYINSGRVSIISLSLKGHDDISGFNGIHINNKLAERIFMNACIYMSKGIASYIITSKANQFVIPMLDSLQTNMYHNIHLDRSSKSLESISPGASRHHGSQIRSLVKEKMSKKSSGGNSTMEYCAYFISSYIFSEPDNSNHFVHGAGDDAWSSDYYKRSTLYGPYTDQGVHLLLSDFIYIWKDDNNFSCRFPAASVSHRENKMIVTNHSSTTNMVSSNSLSAIQYGWDGFQQKQLRNKRANNTELVKVKEKYWIQTLEKLKDIGYDTIESIKQTKKVNDYAFKTNTLDIPVGRASMKPPFWLILDKVELRQVLTKRYGQK